MTQRTSFAPIPNSDDKTYLSVLTRLFAYVSRSPAPTGADLRGWLKEQSLWNKTDAPVVLDLLGLAAEKTAPVTPPKFVADFLAVQGDDEQSKLGFRYLWDQNPLLAKYVLDALDPEQNGRLHSTHELHRMLESFVYPGSKLTLPDFKAWISWAVGTGGLKLVGIRWGLTDLGRVFAAEARKFDVEEFLEEEAEAREEAEVDEATEDADAAPSAAEPPTPVALPSAPPPSVAPPAGPAAAEAPRVENAPPVSPEPDPAPSAPRPARAPRTPAVVAGAPSAPAVVTWLAPSLPVTPLWGPGTAEAEANRQRLLTWWGQLGKPGHLTLEAFGVSVDELHDAPEVFLARAAFVSLAADLPGVRARLAENVALYRQLADAELFEAYVGTDAPLDEALPPAAWSLVTTGPGLRDRGLDLVALKRNVTGDPDLFARLQAVTDPAEVVRELRASLFAGVPSVLAPYWLVRELHRAGVLGHEAHAVLGAVPGFEGRQAAVRLGLLDRASANGDDDLVRVGRHLAAWFTRDTDYAEPLELVPAMVGCTEAGPRPHACPFHCAHKLPWNL